MVANSKGKGSGYKLARPIDEITMLDIYTAFEPITFVDCINNAGFCDMSHNCTARGMWCELRDETENLLKSKKLSQIVDEFKKKTSK